VLYSLKASFHFIASIGAEGQTMNIFMILGTERKATTVADLEAKYPACSYDYYVDGELEVSANIQENDVVEVAQKSRKNA
jgi:hypothetical protein